MSYTSYPETIVEVKLDHGATNSKAGKAVIVKKNVEAEFSLMKHYLKAMESAMQFALGMVSEEKNTTV